MKIHHIGLIVKNIEKSISLYEKLGYFKVSEIVTDINQNNKVIFLKSPDYTQTLELLEPLDEKSSIYGFKEGYHHICYEVDDPDNFIQSFKQIRIGKIFTKPIIAPAINNRKVVFGCLYNGAFVEFLF